MGGIGAILFIIGITKLRTHKTWSELTQKEKRNKIITLAVLALSITAIAILFLYWAEMVNISDLIRKALIGLTTIFTGILILILTGLYNPSLFNIEVAIMMTFFNIYLLTILFYKNRTFKGLTLFLMVSLFLIDPVIGLFCFIVGTIIYKPLSNKSLKTPTTQTT